MTPPVSYRKLIDSNDNVYVVAIPGDVDPNSVEDILIAAQEKIVTILAYRLKGDVYRDMQHQELGTKGKSYNGPAYKKLFVYDPDQSISDEDFGTAMSALLNKAKDDSSKIGKIRITEWQGEPVLYDKKGFPFVERTTPCSAKGCNHVITGRQQVSTDKDGTATRLQHFIPNDKDAKRAKMGSKLWLCGACSVRHIEPPSPPPAPDRYQSSEPEEKKETSGDVFATMLELSQPTSDVDPQFFKGFVCGVLTARKGGS